MQKERERQDKQSKEDRIEGKSTVSSTKHVSVDSTAPDSVPPHKSFTEGRLIGSRMLQYLLPEHACSWLWGYRVKMHGLDPTWMQRRCLLFVGEHQGHEVKAVCRVTY